MFTLEQLKYVAIIANKEGGKGNQLKMIIPPSSAAQSDLAFNLVFEKPIQDATDRSWTD